MAPAWLQGPLLTLALLFAGECCGQDPNTVSSGLQCGGNRQSPIDIIPENAKVDPDMGLINLDGYWNSKKLLSIRNTGAEVLINLGDGLILRGPGLPASFIANSVRFHWGNGNQEPGSEHRIGGKQYTMELQIYHMSSLLSNVHDALRDPKGFAALGFLVQGNETARGKESEAWKKLSYYLSKISTKGQVAQLNVAFSLLDLLGSTDLSRYYRYNGSFTGGKCNEAVIWTIFAEPILVPPEVVNAFPKLYGTESSLGPHLVNNFRPIQKLWDRTVAASAKLKEVLRSASSLDAQPAKFFLLLFITLTFFLSV